MKFPKRLRHNGKGRVLATIYKRPHGYVLYWRARVDGKAKSHFKDFTTYAKAKKEGDQVVSDLHKGKVSDLSPGQTSEARASLEVLRDFYVTTGRKVTLLGAVSDWVESARKLFAASLNKSLGTVTDDYLASVATVKRMDLGKAVGLFLTAEEPRTKASDGKRPEVSPKYHKLRDIILNRFADTFPSTAVCELTRQQLDLFIATLGKVKTKSRNHRAVTSAKSRNNYRGTVRQFLGWAVRNDYLSPTHRLNEADQMRPENGNAAEILFYTPAEFKALLDRASKQPAVKKGEKQETDFNHLVPMLAIGGLAGLRTQEMLRLTWEDTRRVENHIEVTAGKAKTRQRRLVEIVPSLAQWLAPYSERTGKVWELHEVTFQQHFGDLCAQVEVEVKGKKVAVARKQNGLRHSFCSYHFAAHGNENLTAQQAGNSPAMLHANYKGLATRKEGERWFAVTPEQPVNVIQLAKEAKAI